jgi:hypothetical protein
MEGLPIIGWPFVLIAFVALQSTVAGVRLSVFLVIRVAEQTCLAMPLVTAIGAAVYFDFELITRRLRLVNVVRSSLVALTLITTLGFFAMLMRIPRW